MGSAKRISDTTTSRILILEPEPRTAQKIKRQLKKLGYEVIKITDSGEASVQAANDSLPDAILIDLALEGTVNGIEAAARIKAQHDIPLIFLIDEIDDNVMQQAQITEPYQYILKPCRVRDLHLIIEMALHNHRLEIKLKEQEALITELRHDLEAVNTLKGILPICSSCKKIRDDQGGWQPIELYVKEKTNIDFSHGICPDCAITLYPDLLDDYSNHNHAR